jgi:hypothetical protein
MRMWLGFLIAFLTAQMVDYHRVRRGSMTFIPTGTVYEIRPAEVTP